jgi:hypothetical protein
MSFLKLKELKNVKNENLFYVAKVKSWMSRRTRELLALFSALVTLSGWAAWWHAPRRAARSSGTRC